MNLFKRILISSIIIALLIPLTVWASSQRWELRKRAQRPTANVYLEPTSLTLGVVGTTGTIKVMLGGVSESAGFQFELAFDKNIVRVDDVTLLTAPSGSITLMPLKDIRNAEGRATFGVTTLCNAGVCPNILGGSPAVLATLTVSAVGKGKTNLEFDSFYTLYGVVLGTDGMPVKTDATLTNGRVNVKKAPTPTPRPTPTRPPKKPTPTPRPPGPKKPTPL